MRYLNLVMAVLFLFGAIAQINDPDPVLWMAIYLAASGVCYAAHRRGDRLVPPVVVGVIALAWSILILTGMEERVPVLSLLAEWEMRDQAVEETRESYGLLIIAAWMAILAVRAFLARRRPAPAAPPSEVAQRAG